MANTVEKKYSEQRDEETGYGYFGARYYDSEISGLFLSVNPMADKYPSMMVNMKWKQSYEIPGLTI